MTADRTGEERGDEEQSDREPTETSVDGADGSEESNGAPALDYDDRSRPDSDRDGADGDGADADGNEDAVGGGVGDGVDLDGGGDEEATAAADVDLDSPEYYLNRELSELAFQRRVLFEALDERNPLLERVKFLAIFTTNMDEFFMKRVGGLKQQMDAGVTERTADGRTPHEQWREILATARELFEEQNRCYHEEIRPALAEAGIEIADHDDLDGDDRARLREYFESSVLPTLTPLTFDPAHPFPFISNLSLSLAVLTREGDDDPKFSRVKIPKNRPRVVRVGEGEPTFVPIEQIVEANLDLLFPNVEIVDAFLFRVTRNAEVRRNEEVAEGLIEMIEDVLRQRRFATVVRLEVAADMPPEVRRLLIDQLGVDEREVFDLREPIDFRDFMDLTDLDRPELKLDPWTPKVHPRFAGLDADRPDELFDEIRRDDVLVHHPYHSFANTVQTFLDAAASDPDVLAIKAAIYRTASDSQVIESLIEAVKNGKQVAVMVELKARFDEENNLRWVKRLEEEGIHVAYGTIGLKTHSKTALVVREEDDGVQIYSHVATGNYHSETAKTYVDLGLLTADRDVGQDLVKLFNFFTGHALHERYRKLLVAPENMREAFSRLIRREAEHARDGRDARIVAKMNALEDPEMVKELYRASMAGVDVDLVVRGICRLRPGVEGVSDTVSVHSVVGRFLEHSRIFYFRNDGDPEYYVGSADWMTRNLDRRVEAVAPVEDEALREELRAILEVTLSDNRKRWVMNADGSYDQVRPAEGEPVVNTHERLMRRAAESAPDEEPRPVPSRGRREPSIDLDDVFTDQR
ncbi:polyphosphate kinase 1 [Halegenticoccus soli]|uniref:polyphosphate kinase 1 n=1 Tax=Halegenticoccus soli TaxID=1985678 RepID=UPI000C6D45EF|nr:polyphosphate kinase 1 [Halegenticoccus soli]